MPGDDPYKNFNFKVNLDGKPVVTDPPKKEEGSGSTTTQGTGGFLDRLKNLFRFRQI